MLTKVLVYPATCLLVLAMACGGQDLRDQLKKQVAPYSSELGFNVVVPNYLPPSVSETPTITPLPNGDGIGLLFFSDEGLNKTLNISETLAPTVTEEPLPTGIPNPLPTVEDIIIDGRSAQVSRRDTSSSGSVLYGVTLQGVAIGIQYDWPSASNTRAGMEAEATKVVQSLWQ